MVDWQTTRELIAPTIGLLGGLVGLFGGGLGIYYASTANRVLLQRFRREEETRQVDARADELLRHAYEQVASSAVGPAIKLVPLELTCDLDRKAAWKLQKDGVASLHNGRYMISMDATPAALQRAMRSRAPE